MNAMNKMEQEVVYLSAAIDLIKSMVNREMFSVAGDGEHKNVWFESSTHRQLFSILLVDFLSPTDSKAPVPSERYLAALSSVAKKPSFDVGGSVQYLSETVSSFKGWLNVEISVDAWLPSIDRQVVLRIPRYVLLKNDGDISKHNSLRSVGVAEGLQKLLTNAGEPTELYQAMLAQQDIYDIFHDDVSAYHASTIAEFLNGLWWGIQNYLQPEYNRSFTPPEDGLVTYGYKCPSEIVNPYAKACYWNLMNQVRSGPIFKPFTVTKHLKGKY
ncbi:hypothetical protein PMI34_04448 [Pseudomonas sp. GM74]|nr:hypothetical protein [Pseudomonas sp. GM74]EJM84675.1 hypothetical protein PMI34_04448 [Pseudomonas sp. GM74]